MRSVLAETRCCGSQDAREKIMAQGATDNDPTAPQPGAPGATQQQQLIINAQYIKDLSFENPRAPNSLRQQTTPPAVEINVDVKAQGLAPENYEVVLTIKASAKAAEETMFIIKLVYGADVTASTVAQVIVDSIALHAT